MRGDVMHMSRFLSESQGVYGEWWQKHAKEEMLRHVEDAKENLGNSKLSNNNPMESNQIFYNNLRIIEKLEDGDKSKLEFSRWIISCPLFLCYLNLDNAYSEESNRHLNNTSELRSSLFHFINQSSKDINDDARNIMDWCIGNSIYKKLQQVCIYSSKSNKSNSTIR